MHDVQPFAQVREVADKFRAQTDTVRGGAGPRGDEIDVDIVGKLRQALAKVLKRSFDGNSVGRTVRSAQRLVK